jgi:endonuclease-3
MLSVQSISTVIDRIRAAMKDLPDPSVTLVGKQWKSPYLVLVSCLLSLRTKDTVTLPASLRLFTLAESPQAMVRLTPPEIEKVIFPVGFYRTKALRISEISRDLLERFGGKVPDTLDELLTLKGVGRKTANLVLVEGFAKDGICVDTHVHRISNRLGFVKTRTPDDTEKALRATLPLKFWKEYNALLVLWGQNVCRPVSPRCSVCPVNKICAQAGVDLHR